MSRGQKVFVTVSLLVGVLARLSGIIAEESRLFQQFPTEDGYFMLAIARNLAIGKGFSVAGGAMPTNGTQPLTTLIWSIPFWLADGHRALGVRLTLVLELLGSGTAAYLVYRLAKKVLDGRDDVNSIAAVAAAIWFASPIAVRHSMNTLETGYNAMVALLVAYVFVEVGGPDRRPWSWVRCIPVGILLGIAFWTRNDSVFLILAACLTYVLGGWFHDFTAVRQRFGRAVVFGATSIVTASPWLAYNYTKFGHIMPVSGRAESLTRHAGGNLSDLPPVMVEYMLGLAPIPEVIEQNIVVIVLTALVAAAIALVVGPRLFAVGSRAERMLIVFVAIYGTGLACFYGIAFGAGWFMSRYLFPLGGFFVIAFTAVVFHHKKRWPRSFTLTAGAAFAIAMATVNVRTYVNGKSHPHFQVVEFARRQVPEKMWVGAVQTGTLGFFHDRTINLDGKVNIDAYEAIVGHHKGRYVADGTIEMLIDWSGMVRWLEMPIIDAHFRELVYDPKRNLGVLERKDRRRFDSDLEPDHRLRELLEERYEEAIAGDITEDQRAALHLGLARLYRIDGSIEEAIEHAEKAAAAKNAVVASEAERLRGNAERVRRRRDDARKTYDRAIARLSPIAAENTYAARLLSDIWHVRAELHRLDGDVEAAAKALGRAAELDSSPRDESSTHLALGDLYRDAKDGTRAQTHYERALALRAKPRDLALAKSRLGRLLANTDAGRANELIDEAVEARETAAPVRGIPIASVSETLALGHAVLTSTSANP